jgi:phenylacetate-CoA ligase
MMDIYGLISHLAKNAPGFASRLEASGLRPQDIHSVEDLNSLAVIRKDNLVEFQAANPPFGGFLACEAGDLKRIFQSPGPIYDPESRQPDYWRWAPALRAAGFQAGDLVLNAFGYHLTPAGAMFEEGLWAIGCAVIPGGVGNQEAQVRLLKDLKVSGYVGLPSYLKSLIDKADELRMSLYLDKAFVTAEPLPPTLRQFLNKHGITVRQGYGTAECGNLGYECEQENGWHLPEDALVQICDLTSGEPLPPGKSGEIVVTLYTRDYALVRFGTGDLSTLDAQPCPCGHPTARLMGWQGRVGDAVKVRGLFLHPRQLSELMARFPEVQRWQARITRQEHKDYLTMRIVPNSQQGVELLSNRIAQTAREAIKFNLSVEVVSGNELPPGSTPIEDTRTWD